MKKKIIVIAVTVIILITACYLFIPYKIDSYTKYSPDMQYQLEVYKTNFMILPEQLNAFGDVDYTPAFIKLRDNSSGKVLNSVYTKSGLEIFSKLEWHNSSVEFRYTNKNEDFERINWILPRPISVSSI